MYLGGHKLRYRLSEGGESDTEFKIKSKPPEHAPAVIASKVRDILKYPYHVRTYSTSSYYVELPPPI